MTGEAADHTSHSLIARVRAQDDDAWQQLVHLYGPLVHRWCKRSDLNDDDTADVFQETFRAVTRNIANYRPTKSVGSFRSWLRTIVRTKVADHFRKLNQRAVGQGGTEAHLRMVNVEDPLADDSEDEAKDDHALVVQRAMELIKSEFAPQNWSAFERVAIQGHSAADVARELDVAPQAIRQANYRIRRRLRVILAELYDAV